MPKEVFLVKNMNPYFSLPASPKKVSMTKEKIAGYLSAYGPCPIHGIEPIFIEERQGETGTLRHLRYQCCCEMYVGNLNRLFHEVSVSDAFFSYLKGS